MSNSETGFATDVSVGQLLAASPDCVKLLDLDGNLLALNENGRAALEVEDVGTLLHTCWADWWHGTDHATAVAAVTTARDGGTARFEAFARTAAGNPRWWDVTVSPLRNADGKVQRLLSISRDVTAYHNARDSVAALHDQLRSVIESAKDYAFIIFDPDGCVRDWSRGAEQTFGHAAADVVGKPADSIWTPEDRQAGVPAHELFTARTAGVATDNRWHLHASGRRIFIRGSVRPVHDASGQLTGFTKICRDETHQQSVEQQLADSRRRLDAALVAGEIATWVYDLQTGRVEGDPNLLNLFGVKVQPGEDIEGLPLSRFVEQIHPDDRVRVSEQIGRAVESASNFHAEYRILTDGVERWVIARGVVERDATGRALRLPGVVLDVTDRRRAQAAERALDQRLSQQTRVFDAVLNSLSDPVYIFDLQGLCRFANKPLLALWKLTLPEAIGKTFAELQYAPELIERCMRDIGEVARTRTPMRGELLYASPDGSVGVFEHVFSPVFDESGVVVAVAGSSRDVTARREIESELSAVARQRDALLELQRGISAAAVSDEAGEEDQIATVLAAAVDLTLAVFPKAQGTAIELLEPDPANNGLPMLVYRATSGTLSRFLGLKLDPAGSLSGQCMQQNRAMICDDAKTDPRVARNLTRQTNSRSMLLVPIVQSGVVVGVLKLSSTERAAFTADDALVAQLAVGPITTGLSGAAEQRAIEALRRSEAEFRQLADSMPQIVWAARPDGVLDYYNHQWFEYTRRPDPTDARNIPASVAPEAVAAADRWAEFVHPDDLPRAAAAWKRSVDTGTPYTVEFRVLRGDDTFRWFLVRALAVRGEDGGVTRWFGTCTDVEDQKAAEAALRSSQERFSIAVEAAELGTFHWQLPVTSDTVYDWNDKLRELFWMKPGDVAGPTVRAAAVGVEDRLRVEDALARATDGQARYDIEYQIRGPEGQRRWLRAMGRAFGSSPDTGKPDRFTGVVMDITHRRLAEEEREQLLNAERTARGVAEQASRMKDEFLATLSHELRTPLNAIVGWVQILRGNTDPEDFTEGLGVIDRNARAQTQIIEDILDMSRIVSGKLRLDVQRVDVAALVRAGVDTVQPAADAKGVRLQVLLDPSAGPVMGDPNRLHQVFWNLLNNAVKFTPRNGRVQVRLQRVNSHVEVSVTDTGEGIDPAFLPFVFDRFRQADASTTRQHGGLGLGLSIVKQLIEMHGGSVQVKSPGKGQGATFLVILPLTVLHAQQLDPAPVREHPRTPVPVDEHDQACGQLKGLSVIVVDDEPDGRHTVRRLLEECGAKVRLAGSAAEAMQLIVEEPPAVLVSDIGMPGEDGYSLIGRVRALSHAAGGGIPAIALTAYARAADRVKALEAGFQMHLAKPVEPAELIVTVASVARTAAGRSLGGAFAPA